MQVICLICSDPLLGSSSEPLVATPCCGKTFHESCICNWIDRQSRDIAENANQPSAITRQVKCVYNCRVLEKRQLIRIFLDTESDNAQIVDSCRLKPRKELENELEEMRKKLEELEKSKENEIDYLTTRLVEVEISHRKEIDNWVANMSQDSTALQQSPKSPSAFAHDFYSCIDSSDIANDASSSKGASANEREFIIQKIPETPDGLKEGSQVYLGNRDYSGVVKWLGLLNGKFVAAVHFDLPLGDGTVGEDGSYRGVKLFENPDPEYDRFPVYIEELVTELT